MTAPENVDRAWSRVPRISAVTDGRGIYVLLTITALVSYTMIVFSGGTFDLRNIAVRSVGLGLVAAGQTIVIVAGSIDLSVSFLITLTAMLTAFVSDGEASRIPLAVAVVLAVGGLIGLVNGLVVTKLHVNGFIATLGMGLVLQGLITTFFSASAGDRVPDAMIDTLGFGSFLGIQWSVWLLFVVSFIFGWVLRNTRLGAHIYGTGGGEHTAKLSGVRADRTVTWAHVMSGLAAAIAGIFLASRLGTPNVEIGINGLYDLESIAAVVLGGAALLGGKGRVGATLAAVFVFALLNVTFDQFQVDPFLKLVVRGVVIIVAVASYSVRSKEPAA